MLRTGMPSTRPGSSVALVFLESPKRSGDHARSYVDPRFCAARPDAKANSRRMAPVTDMLMPDSTASAQVELVGQPHQIITLKDIVMKPPKNTQNDSNPFDAGK